MPLHLFGARHRALLLTSIFAALLSAEALVRTDQPNDVARAAIVSAVRTKLAANGTNVDVQVENLEVRGDVSRSVVAQVPPGARTGVRTRFALLTAAAPTTQVGEADATITVNATYVRAARPIHRGTVVDAAAVVEQSGDVGSILLQPLTVTKSLGGAVAAREIAQGDVLVASLLTMPAIVKTGDRVVVRAAAGAVYVQAVVVAAQPGSLGDVIRCVNPDTRKAMAARIVAPGLAEVVHAF